MTKEELRKALDTLTLSQADAAQLLGVSTRTLRRWMEGEEIPGPARAAIRAWLELHKRKLAWKPDSITIFENDKDQLSRIRDHSIRVAGLLAEVEQRGGPKTFWTVDLRQHQATFGAIEVGFYLLANGGFSLSTYTRRDTPPDLEADMPLVEDAAACIADALGKWKECSDALHAVVKYLRDVHRVFASSGPRLTSSAEKAKRSTRVDNIADRIADLAERALTGDASPSEFEDLNRELHEVGMFAENQLVSDVARAFYRAGRT
jgi:hypothetical protein